MNIEKITELCATLRDQADTLDSDQSGKFKALSTVMQLIAELPQDGDSQASATIPTEVFEALGPDLRFIALSGFIAMFAVQIQKS